MKSMTFQLSDSAEISFEPNHRGDNQFWIVLHDKFTGTTYKLSLFNNELESFQSIIERYRKLLLLA